MTTDETTTCKNRPGIDYGLRAIETRYLGPTNYRGSRIKAHDGEGHSVTLSYDYSLNNFDAHRQAALALRDKMNWKGELVGGGTKHGYVFVFIS